MPFRFTALFTSLCKRWSSVVLLCILAFASRSLLPFVAGVPPPQVLLNPPAVPSFPHTFQPIIVFAWDSHFPQQGRPTNFSITSLCVSCLFPPVPGLSQSTHGCLSVTLSVRPFITVRFNGILSSLFVFAELSVAFGQCSTVQVYRHDFFTGTLRL